MNLRLTSVEDADSFQSHWQHLKKQWPVICISTVLGIFVATAMVFMVKPRYEVKALLDRPYINELVELNFGRSGATELEPYSPDQVYVYFLRRLMTNEAKERFFNEIYIPSLDSLPESEDEKQTLYNYMSKAVLKVVPPPEKVKSGRALYEVDVAAHTGVQAAKWLQAFLTQVSEDARLALIKDIEQSIGLRIKNTERALEARERTAELMRKDRQAQLTEALKVAQVVGIKEPQMTAVQPPRQDTAASYLDGSRLYARGSKSLQAELDVLENRQDDTPFIEGLRETQQTLALLKELNPAQKNFKIFHVDGEIVTPSKPVFPKKSVFLGLGLFFGLAFGIFLAMSRSGLLRKLLAETMDAPIESPLKLEAVRKTAS